MGVNSIRCNLTKDQVINEIKMSLSAPGIHVLVEGEGDIELLNKLLGAEVTIYESFSGKTGVLEIIEHFTSQHLVIGVVDRDYDDIELERIFCYDYCCGEAMILAEQDVINTLCAVYYKCEPGPEHLLLEVLNRLKYLSILRQFNYRYKWEIKFKGLPINKLFNAKEQVTRKKIIAELNERSNKQFRKLLKEKKEEINNTLDNCKTKEELLSVANGHDLIGLLSSYLKTGTKKPPSKGDLARSLRMTYGLTHFSKTKLFTTLKEYQTRTDLKILRET